ncbi:MICAL-like protein 1 isoform X2 [Takifugu flavidus]|uniref:MICAL-like protein 1 isoform X2 n=1 Tax=Takifugu flavidus TaxID=433684 RepID=UPI002544A970|nr:MICAL-like protein 1 isoform X2 [Takifugu flavidus]
MTSLTALRDWCRDACAGYPDVEIKNMSASFRDGLAFCAIIHKHRPDLIDFSALSKDNSYQNNQLAFETAENLGIPALLHPKELACSEVPDSLGVITYLFWYFCFFRETSSAGLASLGTSHVTDAKQLPRTKTPDGPKQDEDSSRRESHRGLIGPRSSKVRVPAVCRLCLKPIYLIQRRLAGGKIYHRSCLRCGVCHCTLLPHWCTQRGDSLVCSHHPAGVQGTEPELSGSAENRVRGSSKVVRFLGESAVSSATGYTEGTQSGDKLASEAADREEKGGEETGAEGADSTASGQRLAEPSDPPAPAVAHVAVEEAESCGAASSPLDATVQQEVTQQLPELSTKQEQVGDHGPASGCMPSPSVVPVAPPRASTSQTTNSSLVAENSASQCTCSAQLQRSSSASGVRLRLNHPWLTIIHPGPWMQLPAAPPPVTSLRPRHRPRVSAPNPFERVDEEAKPQKAAANQSGRGASGGGVSNPAVPMTEKPHGGSDETVAGDALEGGNRGDGCTGPADARAHVTLSQQPKLPRSLSVPAFTCSVPPPEGPELLCREAHCNQKAAWTKSQTFHTPPSEQAPAPGHGFPLIKRKVQTDQNICPGSLQVEVTDLDKRLEAMERRGVELERNLRHCEEEEEEMLMEWFDLNHERHVLVRRDMELGYLMMQHKLEERQADVEYELRRLLIKQENEWTEEERAEERHLMEELVSLIEQRNQIICSLDQDVQREREEDKLLKATLNSKQLQKEGIKELRKSKGKLNPGKVFNLLHRRRSVGTKHPPDQRS